MRTKLSIILMAILIIATQIAPASAGLVQPKFKISDNTYYLPMAVYGSVSDKFLAVLGPNCRLVGCHGETNYTERQYTGQVVVFTAAAYNSEDNEYLVTWKNVNGELYGQRVNAATGELSTQGNFFISSNGGHKYNVAWSKALHAYIVVFAPNGYIYGQLVAKNPNGTWGLSGGWINISQDANNYLYPNACGSNDQLLVTWDGDGIQGRRLYKNAQGVLTVSPLINVSAPVGGYRSHITYNSRTNKWLVQYNTGYPSTPTADQYGRFIAADGTPEGSPFPIANTPAFEGETLYGCTIACCPNSDTYFSSFQLEDGVFCGTAGQNLDMNGLYDLVNGMPKQTRFVESTYTYSHTEADTTHNRFLIVWLGEPSGGIWGQFWECPPQPVSNLSAMPGDKKVTLSWTNPSDQTHSSNPADYHFKGVMIRYSTASYPAYTTGTLLINKAGTPGSADTYTHTNLNNGTTYYYSAFAYDAGNNYSLVANVCVKPSSGIMIYNNTFDSNADDWTKETWKSGVYSAGVIAWNAAAGNPGGGVRCGGFGTNDNDSKAEREGGQIRKLISTVGFRNVKVNYDLRVGTLGLPPGTPTGSGTVDHSDIQEQLTISYCTTGNQANPNLWTEANAGSSTYWLNRNLLMGYQNYGSRSVNLVGVSGVDNNPNFALKFRWQFNTRDTDGDFGDLDNIQIWGYLADYGSVSAARKLQNNQSVTLSNKVLYYKNGNVGYIEEKDRFGGMRIEGNITANAGNLVYVSGKVQTNANGEKYVAVESMYSDAVYTLKPLGANNKTLRDSMMDGMLITAWGKVKAGSITANSFILTDGYDTGIKVITQGAPGVTDNQYVTITGAAGYEGSRVIYKK